MMAVPQSGPHAEEAAAGGFRLERDFLVEGDVVAEDHDVGAGGDGVHGLDEGVGAGDGDEGEVCAATVDG